MFGLIRERRLLIRMVERDLRSKYVGSLIGVFWTVINPLLLLLVFTFIFSVVFHARFGNETGVGVSALYILCGLIPWLGFQEGVARSASFMIENRNLITRVKFPVQILPAVPVLSGFLGQLIGFIVLLAWAGIKGKLAMPAILFLPVWMIFQIAISLGLGYLLAIIGVWVRDVIQLIPVMLLVWMYATPIFYPADLVPQKFQFVIAINPVAQLVDGYRKLILEGTMPTFEQSMFVAGAALFCLGIGGWLFFRLKAGISDRL